MVGQLKNKEILKRWRLNKSVPRFIIIEGDEGSGRLTFSKIVIKMLNANGVIIGNSINDVRTMIENCYQIVNKTVYVFRDCDEMSVQAKNSLLKIVEEPPNNCYIIMTVNDMSNMLDTLKSRASIIKMEPYTKNQLLELSGNELAIKYYNTPKEVLEFDEKETLRIDSICKDILHSLFSCSGTSVLKECVNLKAKATDENEIDCDKFFSVFSKEFFEWLTKYNLDTEIAKKLLKIRSDARLKLRRKSVNKRNNIEAMLIEMLMEVKNGNL